MGDKPFLHIEIDEHSAVQGRSRGARPSWTALSSKETTMATEKVYYEKAITLNPASALPRFGATSLAKRTIYLPSMCAHSFAIRAAFEACGINSEMLPDSDRESVDVGEDMFRARSAIPIHNSRDMLKKVLSSDFRLSGLPSSCRPAADPAVSGSTMSRTTYPEKAGVR